MTSTSERERDREREGEREREKQLGLRHLRIELHVERSKPRRQGHQIHLQEEARTCGSERAAVLLLEEDTQSRRALGMLYVLACVCALFFKHIVAIY